MSDAVKSLTLSTVDASQSVIERTDDFEAFGRSRHTNETRPERSRARVLTGTVCVAHPVGVATSPPALTSPTATRRRIAVRRPWSSDLFIGATLISYLSEAWAYPRRRRWSRTS